MKKEVVICDACGQEYSPQNQKHNPIIHYRSSTPLFARDGVCTLSLQISAYASVLKRAVADPADLCPNCRLIKTKTCLAEALTLLDRSTENDS